MRLAHLFTLFSQLTFFRSGCIGIFNHMEGIHHIYQIYNIVANPPIRMKFCIYRLFRQRQYNNLSTRPLNRMVPRKILFFFP